MDDKRTCSECGDIHDARDFSWTYDRYGIEWRKVCDWCRDKVQGEIDGWQFDAGDAGECLEAEDY